MTFPAKLSVAPMMDYTDRHFRYFLRLLSKNTMLYTEMVTAQAIIHGDRDRLLGFHTQEQPIALQIGGSDPKLLTECALIAEQYGYDEINLNVGCPSDRVQSGYFGLCLMADPKLVASCVASMKKAVSIPITVKTRIGYDHNDSYAELKSFVQMQTDVGVDYLCIHARKGWLKGLSPKENREIPPLDYQRVYQIKADFPDLPIGINGGIKTLAEAEQHLKHIDSVMIGRAAYHDCYLLAQADQLIFNDDKPLKSRKAIIEELIPYVEQAISAGTPLKSITRHILGLFHGEPNAKIWRRMLSDVKLHKQYQSTDLLKHTLSLL